MEIKSCGSFFLLRACDGRSELRFLASYAFRLHEYDRFFGLREVLLGSLILLLVHNYFYNRSPIHPVRNINFHHATILFQFFFFPHLVNKFLLWSSPVDSKFFHGFELNVWILGQGEVILSNRFACLLSFLLKLIQGFVLLKLLVTADAGKIRLEIKARTRFTFIWGYSTMFLMCVLADARGTPGIDIKPFSAGHPPLAKFFRTSWDESEFLARASRAVSFKPTLVQLFAMVLEKVATKALRVGSYSKTVFFSLLTYPCDVNPTFYCFIRMVELPRHNFLCTWSWPNLRDQLHDLRFAVSLSHYHLIKI